MQAAPVILGGDFAFAKHGLLSRLKPFPPHVARMERISCSLCRLRNFSNLDKELNEAALLFALSTSPILATWKRSSLSRQCSRAFSGVNNASSILFKHWNFPAKLRDGYRGD